MDNRSIGVFDSGLGGLTSVREMRAALPSEHIVYFGDTGRVPYGTRSNDTVIKYVRQNIRFLLNFDIKALLIACGTGSSIALPIIGNDYSIPVIGVVDSAVRHALTVTKSKRVGVIATPGTIASRAYESMLSLMDSDIETIGVSCPLFVPLVENGRFRADDTVVRIIVEEYLQPVKRFGVDTLILGCTHYPLLSDAIAAYMGEHVTLVDSGVCAVTHLSRILTAENALRTDTSERYPLFYVSDNVRDFSRIADIFLGGGITGKVEKIDIEKY